MIVPPGTYLQQYQFRELANKFTLRGKRLYYQNREVIAAEDVNNILTRLYSNVNTRITGRDRLYKTLAETYYGITKASVSTFLNSQELNRVHRAPQKAKDVIPIVTKRPYERWQMDIIVMGEIRGVDPGRDDILTKQLVAFPGNNGYKNIFTVIDCFTNICIVCH